MNALSEDSLVSKIYQAVLDPAGWDGAVAELSVALDCLAVHLFVVDIPSSRIRFRREWGVDQAALALYGNAQTLRDLWPQESRIKEHGAQCTVLMEGNGPSSNEPGAPMVCAFPCTRDAQCNCGGLLSPDGQEMTVVVMVRKDGAPGLSDLQRDLLRRVTPHVQRSARIFRDYAQVRDERDAASKVLFEFPVAIALLDSEGRCVFTNRTAGAVFQRGDGLGKDANGRLRSNPGAAGLPFERVIEDVLSGRSESAIASVARNDHALGYGVVVTALTERVRQSGRRAVVAVCIADPDVESAASADAIRELYGLTRAESRMVRSLVHGLSLDEAAVDNGVTVATARSTLSQIFRKTGTTRQVDLVRLVVSGPAMFELAKNSA